MPGTPSTCVVLCYWTGHPIKNLYKLLDQMRSVDAGCPFDTVIVVNGGDKQPVELPARFDDLRARVINRENHGYNIEAWDVGWRDGQAHEFYLFLQSECFLKGPNWVEDFAFRMARDRGIGLLGEHSLWEEMTWSYVREATDRDLGASVLRADQPLHPVDEVQVHLEKHGYPLTDLGTYLDAIILFTSRAVLEEVGGFPLLGNTYREAYAGEVGFSRVIASKGYRITKVRGQDFTLIGHRQYTMAFHANLKFRGKIRAALKKVGLKR